MHVCVSRKWDNQNIFFLSFRSVCGLAPNILKYISPFSFGKIDNYSLETAPDLLRAQILQGLLPVRSQVLTSTMPGDEAGAAHRRGPDALRRHLPRRAHLCLHCLHDDGIAELERHLGL
jgi:hypothetical protein